MTRHLNSEEILAFRDGESTDPNIRRHLDRCEGCSRDLQAARTLADLLKTVKAPVVNKLRHRRSVDTLQMPAPAAPMIEATPNVPLEAIRQSRSIGLLVVRQEGPAVQFEHSLTPTDHSFLEYSERASFAFASPFIKEDFPRILYRADEFVQADPFEFRAGEFRIAVSAEDNDGARLTIQIRTGRKFVPSAGLELTLLDSANPPNIQSLNQEGAGRLELRSTRSILLLHSESVSHLGIELA